MKVDNKSRRIKIITSEDVPHITYRVLAILKELDIGVNMMEVYTYVIYLKLPAIDSKLYRELLNELYSIDVVEKVEEVDLIAFEERDIEMKQILDIIPQGIMVLDLEREIKYVNNYFAERILSVPADDMMNRKLSEYIDSKILDNFWKHIDDPKKVIRNKEIVINNDRYTFDLTPMMDEENSIVIGYIMSLNESSSRYIFENLVSFDDIIGNSDQSKEVIKEAKQVSDMDAPVLIIGEEGTGKELLARSIHGHGERKNKPFVSINCEALPEQQLERELFGFVGISDLGNLQSTKSAFELAEGGTLFIEQIGMLSRDSQMRLRNIMKSGRLEAQGNVLSKPLNTRIIFSTTDRISGQDDSELRDNLKFLYDLGILRIEVPALRDRREEIEELANFFLKGYMEKHNISNCKFSTKAMRKLNDYKWPENIRELQNVVERGLLTSDGRVIKASDIELDDMKYMGAGEISLNKVLGDIERSIIVEALDNNKSIRGAARKLDVTHTLLINRIKKYEILDEEWK